MGSRYIVQDIDSDLRRRVIENFEWCADSDMISKGILKFFERLDNDMTWTFFDNVYDMLL